MAKSYEQIRTQIQKRQTKNVDEVRTKGGNFRNTLRPKSVEKIFKNTLDVTGFITGTGVREKEKL